MSPITTNEIEPDCKFKLATFNVDGIRAPHKIVTLRNILSTLQLDFLCICEVNTFTPISICDNYKHTYSLSPHPVKQSNERIRPNAGLLILSRSEIPIYETIRNRTTPIPSELQGRFSYITIVSNQNALIHIVAIYAPVQPEKQPQFYAKLKDELNKLKATGSIIIAGDWNAITDPIEHNGKTNRLISNEVILLKTEVELTDCCPEHATQEYTCFTVKEGDICSSRIDKIMLSPNIECSEYMVLQDEEWIISTHRPVVAEFIFTNQMKDHNITRFVNSKDISILLAPQEELRKIIHKQSRKWYGSLAPQLRQAFGTEDTQLELRSYWLSEGLAQFQELTAHIIPKATVKKRQNSKYKSGTDKTIGINLKKIHWARSAIRAAYKLCDSTSTLTERQINTLKHNMKVPHDVKIPNLDTDEETSEYN